MEALLAAVAVAAAAAAVAVVAVVAAVAAVVVKEVLKLASFAFGSVRGPLAFQSHLLLHDASRRSR